MDPRPQSFEFLDSPWSHVEASTRNPTEQAALAMHLVDKVLNDTVGSGSSRNSNAESSPRGCEANATLPHGLAFQFSKLNDPAFNLRLQSATESEYLGTEDEYQNITTTSITPGSERGTHAYNHTSHIYPPSEFDTEETWSTISHLYYGAPTEYVYESGSINPQQLQVSDSQPVSNYCPTYSSMRIEPSLSSLQATTATYYEPNVEIWYCPSSDSEDAVPVIGNSSGEESEAVEAQSVRNDLKKSGLKKGNSKRGKKRGAKGSIKGVQKSGEGKGVRGRKSKDRYMCDYHQCSKVFSNASELRKHMQVKHLRPFKCTFSFAGCDQIFGSKNEWKRHVTSQHMYLSYWECNLSLCKDRQAFFNRKDLFGQHLKRMHVPHSKKVESFWPEMQRKITHEQNRVEMERWVREEVPSIQDSCFKILRETPLESNCEICGFKFSGPKSWDLKMEHVGKHYENGDQPLPDGPFEDKGLIEWALEHQLVMERDPYDSLTSESNYLDHCSKLSPSAQKAVMDESLCKYQFTKANQFIPRSTCRDLSPIQNSDNLPLPRQAEDISYSNVCPLLFDGAFNDAAPGDHDTRLLLSGGRIMLP
ncbi:hypothetical protein BGX38DRAFT_1140381 [Terfezia claveryi]|nr:hypothetical protein BGX38DRAFT_1140381 [Terfezia claveryi]